MYRNRWRSSMVSRRNSSFTPIPYSVEKVDWIEVEITKAMKRKAEDMAKVRRKNWNNSLHLKKTSEYTGALGELCVRFFLYEYNRYYEAIEFSGSDNGIDINTGMCIIDVKSRSFEEYEPELSHKVYVRKDLKNMADYYCGVFVVGDSGYIVGMESADEIKQDKYLGTFFDKSSGTKYEAWTKNAGYLTIKPAFLVSNRFTFERSCKIADKDKYTKPNWVLTK